MAADAMFYQPNTLAVKDINENNVTIDRLIIGVTFEGQAKAYNSVLGISSSSGQIGSKPTVT